MKTLITIFFGCFVALLLTRCDIGDANLLQDPNIPSPDNVSADFLLSNIQINTAGFFNNVENEPGELTRMYQFAGLSYPSAYQGQSFDVEWRTAYASVLEDVKTLIPLANKQKLFSHVGIARTLEAYILVALVDKFGDVPLSAALDESNFNPDVDSGQDVYNAALAQLDSAKAAFNKDELSLPKQDLYYGDKSDPDKSWITLVNTLQLKILFQERLVSDNTPKIMSLLNGDVIDQPGESFNFSYSNNAANPDSRDPDFTATYRSSGISLGLYMSNYYMNLLVNDKSVTDPRIRYYFYREVSKPTDDVNLQQCINNAPPTHYNGADGKNGHDPFCEDWNDVGYWGRDHGNALGIPADTKKRTTYGVYPAGGRFDANQAEIIDPSQGLKGAGIQPMWMWFYTFFVKAEMQEVNGNSAGAQMALKKGVQGSIQYVMNFGAGNNPSQTNAVAAAGGSDFVPTQTQIDTYVSDVMNRFTSASGTQAKLNVIAKEFYLALWGDGLDSYNLYRRIAPAEDAPNWNLQPNLSPDPGTFYLSLTYPSNFVERNSNVSQKESDDVKVFWDNNNVNFDF